jgi:hypothetical protein
MRGGIDRWRWYGPGTYLTLLGEGDGLPGLGCEAWEVILSGESAVHALYVD